MFSSYYPSTDALPAYAPESGFDLPYKSRFNVPSTQQLNQSMLLKQQINPLDAIIGTMERSQPAFDPIQYRMANMSRFGGYPLESTCHPSAAWLIASPLDSMVERLQNEKLAHASLASFDAPSLGYSQVFPKGISAGLSPISLASRNPWAVSGSESIEKKNILHGLTLDHFKNLKAHAVIDDALRLLKGTRQTDKVWNAINSGIKVSPEIVSEAIKVDRMVDARVADLLQTMLDYRRRNTEAIDVSEKLLAGKMYSGIKASPIELDIKDISHSIVKNELESLYAFSGRL